MVNRIAKSSLHCSNNKKKEAKKGSIELTLWIEQNDSVAFVPKVEQK